MPYIKRKVLPEKIQFTEYKKRTFLSELKPEFKITFRIVYHIIYTIEISMECVKISDG